MNFKDDFDKITDNKFKSFKIASADLKERPLSARFVFLLSEKSKFPEFHEEKEIKNALKFLLPEGFAVGVEFHKNPVTEERLKAELMGFLSGSVFSSLKNAFLPEDLKVDGRRAEIYFYSHFVEYAQKFDFIGTFSEKLKAVFYEPVEIEIKDKGAEPKKAPLSAEPEEALTVYERLIVPTNRTAIEGEAVKTHASYIADAEKPAMKATLCGKVGNIKENTAKSSGNLYYTFNLNDTTGTIDCKFFTKSAEQKLQDLKEGMSVIIEGALNPDTFSRAGGLYLVCRKISACDIDFGSIVNQTELNADLDFYRLIKPEPYTDTKQESIFSAASNDVPPFLTGKTFVIYDFETTGLEISTLEITEIAAVKMVDGEITEVFTTLVNPGIPIPPAVVKKTGITEAMVRFAPKFKEIFPDFHKFLGRHTLVGHNILQYDNLILSRFAKEYSYSHVYESLDTCALARKYMPGLPNHKLGTVANSLGVDLTGAHRALNDVIANAEVFKKLSRYLG